MQTEIVIDGYRVIVDSEDEIHLLERKWHVIGPKGKNYVKHTVKANGFRTITCLHHLLVGKPPTGMMVDHINGNRFDNRKSNLRVVSARENARNARKRSVSTSRFKGVYYAKDEGIWRASIRTDNGPKYLGRFKDECEAAACYDIASLKYHGEYGSRNFLPLM